MSHRVYGRQRRALGDLSGELHRSLHLSAGFDDLLNEPDAPQRAAGVRAMA